MNKIPTVFLRDPENMSRVLDEVNPECQWVIDGEGVATRKYDGTCVMRDGEGKWWARREVKADKNPPPNYLAINYDENTGKTIGWEPIEQSSFHKVWIDATINHVEPENAGTYELVGPRVNGNPEGYDSHRLIPHAEAEVLEGGSGPHTPEIIKNLVDKTVRHFGWEGLVWHHSDGRMAKLKVRDVREK